MEIRKIISASGHSGTTLVELLVVILIIAILSAMLLPAFTKNVVQARYAAEAVPLVGHIRTQIAMYQYEHGKMPFDSGEYSYAQDGSSFTPNFSSSDGATSTTASPIRKLGMNMSELCGKKLTPDQVSFACRENGKGYMYAVGVFGKKGGLGEGTGYAVLEAYFPNVKMGGDSGSGNASDKGYKLIATWSNYTGEGCGDEPGQISFTFADGEGAEGEGKCALFQPELLEKESFEEAVSAAKEALGASSCGTWDL